MASMHRSPSGSFLEDFTIREMNGSRVRKRSYMDGLESGSGGRGAGVLTIEHGDSSSPPLALSFAKTTRCGHLLAIADEDGFISVYDTRHCLTSLRSMDTSYCEENAKKSCKLLNLVIVGTKISEWLAHDNAIFNACWSKEDSIILTASGDQTIRIWYVETKQILDIMWGHSGSIKTLCSHPDNPSLLVSGSRSIKTLCSHPDNPSLLVSGSRDGCIALWDRRCNAIPKKVLGKTCLMPIAMIQNAHPPNDYHCRPTIIFRNTSSGRKHNKQAKAASRSITSILYLKDGLSVVSGGAVDSVIKFWDSRNLKTSTIQAQPHAEMCTEKKRGAHGVTCLSQDRDGASLAASCMDSRIYLYNVLQPDKGPLKWFSGHLIESFYIKSAISPDGDHLLCGSTDGFVYMWQVDKPEAGPMKLEGHEAEVTAVDWCPSEVGKIATAGDDYTVRVWGTKSSSYKNCDTPPVSRRRLSGYSETPRSKPCQRTQSTDDQVESPTGPCGQASSTPRSPTRSTNFQLTTPKTIATPELATPNTTSKLGTFEPLLEEERLVQKTPENTLKKSPSSVLSPPFSLKRRTIRDYFVASS